MCVVSMVGDHYSQKWTIPQIPQFPQFSPGLAGDSSGNVTLSFTTPVTREEFEALRKEVLEMKELLKKAKEYDEKTGQVDCEMEEKLAVLRKVAEAVGVDLSDVLITKKPV